MKSKPTPPLDLWARIDCEVSKINVKPPDSAFRVKDLAKRYNVSQSKAFYLVKQLVSAGKIELAGRYTSHETPYYILKE